MCCCFATISKNFITIAISVLSVNIIYDMDVHNEFKLATIIINLVFMYFLITCYCQCFLTGFGPIGFPPRKLMVKLSQLAGFQCGTNNSFTPPYTVDWFKDGVQIFSQSRTRIVKETGSLFIRDIVDSDRGQYKCVVSNVAGKTTSASAELRIMGSVGMLKLNLK